MKTFISTNKVYKIHPSEKAGEFIAKIKDQSATAHTVIFFELDDAAEAGLELLEKILEAAKLSSSDYILLDRSLYPSLRLRHLQNEFPLLKHVIIFDQPLTEIGLNAGLPLYKVKSIGKFEVLKSDALSRLLEQEGLKRNLWNALKALYSI